MNASLYDMIYYVYVLLFGAYVSLRIARGAFTPALWRTYALLCPALLLLQGLCLGLLGEGTVWLLYPLLTHLPLVLTLAIPRKVRWDAAVVSVVVSYSLCQLLRWVGLVIRALHLGPAVQLLIHLACCQLLLILLDLYCLESIHRVLRGSPRLLRWFGALPVLFYLYEYFMLYTNSVFEDVRALHELLPTAMALFYVLFAIAYQREMDKRRQAEAQGAALELRLSQAQHEINLLRVIEEQTAIHRHDLHHHLGMIASLIASGKAEQAAEYIRSVESQVADVVPNRFCENETVNLLLCAFRENAAARDVTMTVKTSLPQSLSLPDTELCALLSNGLENALHAAAALPDASARTVDVYCGVKQNNLLIEIKNPYGGEVVLQDGLPAAHDGAQHYGCRSMQSIAQRHMGHCSFEPQGGVFILRIAIPLKRPGKG